MKSFFVLVLLFNAANVAFAGSEKRHVASADLSYENIMSALLSQSGALKTQDGKVLADVLGTDLIQHYSGSDGNRLRLDCTVDVKTCDLVVHIFYKPHGDDDGSKQDATYHFNVKPLDGKLLISDLRYSIKDL